jgi:carbonic anhydrase
MTHRWTRHAATLGQNPRGHEAAPAPSALLLTCSADCFAPALLAPALEPGAWRAHRTPGNVVPPRGAGFAEVEAVIEQALAGGAEAIAVCGHAPCAVLSRLLDPLGVEEFLLRDWLDAAEAARLAALAEGSACLRRRARTLAEHNVRAQLAHLRTHPAVAAGRVRLFGWLYDHAAGRLLREGASGGFDRCVALDPDQNRWLRRDYRLARRQTPPLPSLGTHRRYLA